MNLSKALHQTAMEYSTFAKVAKAKGQLENAKEFYKKAFELEQEAAFKIKPNQEDVTPRFILKRSAAALAFKAGFFNLAKEIINTTLTENPPTFIVIELEEILNLMNPAKEGLEQKNQLQIYGKLTSANEQKFEIEIADIKTQQHYSIFVPANEMKEIVKTYFSEMVNIYAFANSEGGLVLNKITKAA